MGGESEKERFAFPRTKTFITAVGVLSTLCPPFCPYNLLAKRGFLRHELSRFLPRYSFSSYPPALRPSLRAVRLFVPSSRTRFSSISISLSVSLVLFFFISLLRDVFAFFVSWPILLPLSFPPPPSLSFPFFLHRPSFPSLYSSCRLIKPVDLPSHLSSPSPPPRHRDL